MKRLSDFKDEEGVAVVAKLLNPIANIVTNAKNAKANKEAPIAFVASMLENSPKDVMEIFAILNEVPPEEYHCTGASLMGDTIKLASDAELMALFGLQSQTETSSGSASESTEGLQE